MFRRAPLLQEILIILLLKIVILYVLWAYCFSRPIDKNLTPTDILSHLVTIHYSHQGKI